MLTNFDYIYVLIFILVALILALVIYYLSYFLAPHKPDIEKESAYECGFDPFSDTRDPFDVRFYLVSILFIIFDLEVMFLFPWTLCYQQIGMSGYWLMMLFLLILTIGFVFEWSKGALEWE